MHGNDFPVPNGGTWSEALVAFSVGTCGWGIRSRGG